MKSETTFPYKVLEVEGAEADDCIATVVDYISKTPTAFEKVLVLSGDKDFIQLQKHNFVKQFSPVQKKFMNGQDPHLYIKEHIMKGDRSDGIPNFLSSDNTFVDELRQKPLTKKKIETWIDLEPSDFCTEEMLRNYQRNKTLIDLDCIPSELKEKILISYLNPPKGERSKLLNYFIQKRLKISWMTLETFNMSRTYTPLLSEVLKKVHNAKTKDKKIAILKENDSRRSKDDS